MTAVVSAARRALTAGVRARIMATAGMSDHDRGRWLELIACAAEPSPYFSPEYLTTLVDHTGEPVMDAVLVAEDVDGTWTGLLPLWNGPRDRAWPQHHLSTGWFHISTPLLRRGAEDDALVAMLRALLRDSPRSAVLDFPFLPKGSAAVDRLQRAARTVGLGLRIRDSHIGPWLAPHADGGTGRPFSRRDRQRIKRLAERVGSSDLTLKDISDEPDAVDRYLALESVGWKSDGTRGGYGLTARPAWFRAIYEARRTRDAIRMLVIDGDPEPAYMALLLIEDDVAYGFLDTYPDDLRELSAGKIGRLLTLGYCAADSRISAFDPCLDPNRHPSADELYPDRRDWVGVTVARKGWPAFVLGRLDSSRVNRGIELARSATLLARAAARNAIRRLRRGATPSS